MNSSRRSFLELTAGLPLAWTLGASSVCARTQEAGGVRLGVQTYSFRDMLTTPGDVTDKVVAAMREIGLTECEVFEPTLQPPALSADANREAIRQWRLGPGLQQVQAASEKFRRAGIRVLAFNFGLEDSCTDAEVERGVQMTRALGAEILSASTTLSMARRCVAVFAKHKMLLAVHGHSNVSDPNEFATPESFAHALAMSSYYRVNLDIGHFTAAGFDSIAYVRANHQRITHLHIKDRKKNDGPNVPFGQGDTAIGPVMKLLRSEGYPISAHIEYEYAGAGNSVEEVKRCLAYVRSTLA